MKFGGSNTSFDITVDGNPILLVPHAKFLEAHLDTELSWHILLNNLIGKIQSNKCLLSLGLNLLDTHSLKNIYYAHIHSHLTYTITAWGSMATASQIKELSKLQNQCIRIVNKTSVNLDIRGQYETLKILKLEQLITLNLCRLGH